MTQEEKMRIVDFLVKQGAAKVCARCGKDEFVVMHRVQIPTDPDPGEPRRPTHYTPAVAIGCKNCGNMWTHALGLMGFLNQGQIEAKDAG